MGRQRKLESDRSLEVRVFGAVDDSHSAVGQKLDDAEMGNRLSDQSQWIGFAVPRRTAYTARVEAVIDGREPLACLRVGGEQFFDLALKLGIRFADRRESLIPRARFEVDKLLEGGNNIGPPMRAHRQRRASS